MYWLLWLKPMRSIGWLETFRAQVVLRCSDAWEWHLSKRTLLSKRRFSLKSIRIFDWYLFQPPVIICDVVPEIGMVYHQLPHVCCLNRLMYKFNFNTISVLLYQSFLRTFWSLVFLRSFFLIHLLEHFHQVLYLSILLNNSFFFLFLLSLPLSLDRPIDRTCLTL